MPQQNKYISRLVLLFVLLHLGMVSGLRAQVDTLTSAEKLERLETLLSKFDVQAYGVVNYYAFDWETLEEKRNAFDPERFNMYMYYHFSDKLEFKSEIEFEHGGTGATMAFDPLEEFGEFEQEIEKGGAVILEQINLQFKFHRAFNLRMGKMRIYMGNAAKLDKPKGYFTAYRSEVENTILPLGWYETGVELSGEFLLKKEESFPRVAYKAYVMSGLDNSGFSSYNWIRRGHQTRFETVNADALAYALRLDYQFAEGSEIGVNYYIGNATPNRQKNDYIQQSIVTVADAHFTLESWPVRARAYGMLGNVQNSESLSTANRNLSNNLDVKRTPVAKSAAGAYGEIAFDILSLSKRKREEQFYLFTRAEWYDSMLETVGTVSDNPRYEREVLTVGFNYFPLPNVVLKGHYAMRSLGSGEQENTIAAGFGFDF